MVEVSVVTKEGCTPCLRVKRIVGELQMELPQVVFREVDFSSQEGVAIAMRDSILYPPAVLIDGRLFAKGRIGEEELKLAVRSAARSERDGR